MFNSKGFSLKFTDGYLDQQTPEEGRDMQWSKCCHNNKGEDISLSENNGNSLS